MSDTATVPAPANTTAKQKKVAKPADHPKYIVMIVAAVTALKERGGSSRQAILKYIMANYKLGTEVTKINGRLKTSLKAGVKAGTLKHVKGTGASGSFSLGEKKISKPKQVNKPKAAKKPKAKKPAAEKPKEKPAVEKAKKPASEKSKAKKPAAEKPAKSKAASAKPKKAKSPAKTAAKPKKPKTPKKTAKKAPAKI